MPHSDLPEDIPRRRSPLREEIEEALKNVGDLQGRIVLVNLEDCNVLSLDSYEEALEHMKAHKGRWYLSSGGLGVR
ncbi:MAG: hypothetical protein JW986_06695 [Methanotrichaceae archaeon]|nr:hypothetical protein [Methanotrichaceae archaeon]